MEKTDALYQAMLARDYRFDGKFYVGVKTTGIYCRPICPAKPRRENVEFFASAHLAEKRGYRPCLRCRPEAAPNSPAWWGKSALVQRALKAIAAHEYSGADEHAFAQGFGVTSRHLRRLFDAEIGKTPKRILIENRLDFARKLIVETRIPLGEIAFAAGFASIRRFNAAVKDRFKRPPSRMRGHGPASSPPKALTLALAYRPPLDWEASLAFYRSHGIAGLETFSGQAYERVFRFGDTTGLIRITNDSSRPRLLLEVTGVVTGMLGRVAQNVRRMFDLDSDPLLVANAFSRNPHLNSLLRKGPGLRTPRGWDPFETAVASILGQRVSVSQANRLVSQLLRAHGEAVLHPRTGEEVRLFPTPEVLAEASLDAVGTTGARKAALREFARRLADGRLNLGSAQDCDAFRAALREIKGIGAWTAEYISLRCIADTDAFPATDLVLQRALKANPGIDLESIRPWRGYAAAYLWRAHANRPQNRRK